MASLPVIGQLSVGKVVALAAAAVFAGLFFRRSLQVGIGPAAGEVAGAVGTFGSSIGSIGTGVGQLGQGIGTFVTGITSPILGFSNWIAGLMGHPSLQQPHTTNSDFGSGYSYPAGTLIPASGHVGGFNLAQSIAESTPSSRPTYISYTPPINKMYTVETGASGQTAYRVYV